MEHSPLLTRIWQILRWMSSGQVTLKLVHLWLQSAGDHRHDFAAEAFWVQATDVRLHSSGELSSTVLIVMSATSFKNCCHFGMTSLLMLMPDAFQPCFLEVTEWIRAVWTQPAQKQVRHVPRGAQYVKTLMEFCAHILILEQRLQIHRASLGSP